MEIYLYFLAFFIDIKNFASRKCYKFHGNPKRKRTYALYHTSENNAF